jgi:hypothetical protein
MVAGSRSRPSLSPCGLYCAIKPQTGTRAKSLSREHSLPEGAADGLEVDVDPVRARCPQAFRIPGLAVIDDCVEAELFLDESTFRRSRRDWAFRCSSDLHNPRTPVTTWEAVCGERARLNSSAPAFCAANIGVTVLGQETSQREPTDLRVRVQRSYRVS